MQNITGASPCHSSLRRLKEMSQSLILLAGGHLDKTYIVPHLSQMDRLLDLMCQHLCLAELKKSIHVPPIIECFHSLTAKHTECQ